MNSVTVNGQNYEVPDGCSINIDGGNLYVNGKIFDTRLNSNNIEIYISGDISSVKTDRGNIKVNGNVSIAEVGGDLTCNNVQTVTLAAT